MSANVNTTRDVNLIAAVQTVTSVGEDAASTTTAVVVKPAGTTPGNLTDMIVTVSLIDKVGPGQKSPNLESVLHNLE